MDNLACTKINYINDIIKYVEENYIEEEISISELFGVVLPEKKDCYNCFSNIKPDKTWSEKVFEYIDKKQYKDSEVYKRAGISRQNFSEFRKKYNYIPKKDTAFKVCIGLKLNLNESIDLMARAGYSISSSIKRDLVIKYFIETNNYNLHDLNMVLYYMGLGELSVN